MVEAAPVADLFADPKHDYTRMLLAATSTTPRRGHRWRDPAAAVPADLRKGPDVAAATGQEVR